MAATLLTSIDYAKAFNRLDFAHCLKCLHTEGANNKLIRIIASFLSGRVMKTLSMCIAELKSYNPKAFFTDVLGNRVDTTHKMKILGVTFSSDPDMSAHVKSNKKNFRSKKWILHHLRHRGFSKADLLAVYKSTILPTQDYCSCVFNSSLTLSQASALERLQSH